MNLKEKSWIWKLTGPFASNNYTTIWDTIYYPKGDPPHEGVIAHEEIHSIQQHSWGLLALPLWIFCYLFVLPVFWNPFRFKWEYEAYKIGSGWSDSQIKFILRSGAYGWLHNA